MDPPLPKQCSAWDRVKDISVLDVEVLEPTDQTVIRHHFRVLPFSAATSALLAGEANAPALAAAAGQEYRSRVDAIELPPPAPPPPTDPAEIWLRRRRAIGAILILLAVVGVAVLLMMWAYGGAAPFAWGVGPLVLAMMLATVFPWFVKTILPSLPWEEEVRFMDLAELLAERRCCDCGYSLAGTEPAIPEDLAGVDVGPSLCPECASPWPLVPPASRPLSGRFPPEPAIAAAPQTCAESPR